VSGKHSSGRLRVEAWELELAGRIAGSFRPGDEDLKAELFKRLAEIKAKKLSGVQNWQAFLAQSFYNAAKNFIRHEDAVRRRAKFLSLDDVPGEDGSSSCGSQLGAPEEASESRLELANVWMALTPEMRKLALLLFEEEGNISAVAKRLGRSRKTVDYWVQKFRDSLRKKRLE
jgi:RNA polymerase sigma factor (sigma-70 family)